MICRWLTDQLLADAFQLICSPLTNHDILKFSRVGTFDCHENVSNMSGVVLNINSKKRTTCSSLMKTALNNVVLPTLLKVVNNTVQHCCTCLQASSGSTTCSVLLTTLNNVGSKTLLNAVFIRPEQVVRFLLCSRAEGQRLHF